MSEKTDKALRVFIFNKRLLLILGFIFFSAQAWAEKVTFDLENQEKTTVYAVPGFDYYSCKMDNGCDPQNDPIAWPDKNSNVELVLDKSGKPVTAHVNGTKGEWFKVKTSYKREGKVKDVEGWIEGSYLNIPKPKPKLKKPSPLCDDKSPGPEKSGHDILDKAKETHQDEIDKMANKISSKIGQCVIADALPLKKPKSDWTAERPLYDQAILPTLKKQSALVEDGKTVITNEQLIEIDMLSRTMYAEMAMCGHNHPEYLDIVARVVVNRADFDKKFRSEKKSPSEFSDESRHFDLKHREGETPLMGVLTSSRKFNPWDMYLRKGVFNQSGVSQALCPPSSDEVFWGSSARKKGDRVPSSERTVWNKILKVATEAILYQDHFKNRTRDLGDILLFQTQIYEKQNMSKFQNRPQVFRKVDGEKINNNYCAAIYSAAEWQKKYLPLENKKIASAK